MRLLVSVTDPGEVAAALAGGAGIVDVKDPRAGSLGAPAPSVVRAVCAAVGSARPVSVALGDASRPLAALLADARAAAAAGAAFVKLGVPGGGPPARRALRRLVAAMRETGAGTRVVAVAYADSGPTGRGWPLDLPALVVEAGAGGAMLDTARKDGTSLFDHVQESRLADFVAAAGRAGLLAGLAGSLGPEGVRRAVRLRPDVIGVRGAACRGGRGGRVEERRVRRLAHLVARQPPPSGTTTSTRIPAGSARGK